MRRIVNASRRDIENTIDAYIFNERNRRLLCRRMLDGVKLERLAEEFDLSVRQVNTICAQGFKTVTAHL